MFTRVFVRVLWPVGIGFWLPVGALAEGAVKLLDCQVLRACDAAGVCADAPASVSFRMEPIELEIAGAGRYRVIYADKEAEMSAMSDAGPFLWSIDRERHALIASSETQWLWHQLTLTPMPEATIRFLSCTFQQ